MTPGSPNVSLTPPYMHTVKYTSGMLSIIGERESAHAKLEARTALTPDGNYLFRSLAYIITGSYAICTAILEHMIDIVCHRYIQVD